MKAAVSSRIHTNSSTSVATSMVTVPATFRSAIRKIGTLSLRARTVRRSSVASACAFLSFLPSVQLTKTQWMAESETTFARPSSQERASITSIPRARSSSARARTLRPPAVDA